ncbi:hypothetical protein EDC64_102369 [Aquabacter spiritensis]|uniref:Uncharacterized protein n=1 Tax=Aquabacter spiritensis TaxID=933073 RepID=A0A4V2UYC6_9HYPH|nr:hypothetical protein EDC64_102369 [Aquabacter spiritensis]
MRKVRRFSTISVLIMVLGLAAVFGVIAYRMLRSKTVSAGDVVATLPRDARILSTAVADGLVVVTLEVGGAVEIRTYRVDTLAQTGRLRFAFEP